MKKYLHLALLFFLLCHFKVKAQQTICDSIAVDSVYIDGSLLYITVYNSSQHFIAYPYFTFNIDSNAYIQLNNNLNVLSFLSVPGDGNNGFNTASYSGNIAAANTVPLNTIFTGNLIITDPNDSTFNCVFPISFNYGIMPTKVNNLNQASYSIYPIPAKQVINITNENALANTPFQIIDASGRIIKHGLLNPQIHQVDISDIDTGMYYLNINNDKAFTSKIVIIK